MRVIGTGRRMTALTGMGRRNKPRQRRHAAVERVRANLAEAVRHERGAICHAGPIVRAAGKPSGYGEPGSLHTDQPCVCSIEKLSETGKLSLCQRRALCDTVSLR
jgi:hypothetical protein